MPGDAVWRIYFPLEDIRGPTLHRHVTPFSVASLKTIPDFLGTVVLDYIHDLG
jgi:hypothetical protein